MHDLPAAVYDAGSARAFCCPRKNI
jgi:hypothetical protein